MYTISREVVGSYQANAYILTSGDETLVIDPGAEPQTLLDALVGLKVVGIVATHCHSDHIGAVNELVESTGATVMAGALDVAAMADPHLSGFDEDGSDYRVQAVDVALVEGQQIRWGDDQLVVLETPGHTPGSICLLDSRNQILFSGDTLFESGIGRTDFIRGNAREMRRTMLRLGQLSPHLRIFPGHGNSTTIARELLVNPMMGGAR